VKDFFSHMNFPRWVIVMMLSSSCFLGWFVYERSRRLAQVQAELARVPMLVRTIQERGLRLEELLQAESKEKFKVQDDPDTYIRSVAAHDAVRLGQIEITPSVKSFSKGIEDRKFRIKATSSTSSRPRPAASRSPASRSSRPSASPRARPATTPGPSRPRSPRARRPSRAHGSSLSTAGGEPSPASDGL